jgi:hypothetical protein
LNITKEYLDLCDYENLRRAAKIARKYKLHRTGERVFFSDLDESIICLQNELIWNVYFPYMPEPNFKDIVVQIALYTVLKLDYRKYSLDIYIYNLIENIAFSKVVNGKGIIELLKPRKLIKRQRGRRRKKRLHS